MCSCRGSKVWLLKRAQIFVGDVWGAFQVGPGPNSKIRTFLTPMLNIEQLWPIERHVVWIRRHKGVRHKAPSV